MYNTLWFSGAILASGSALGGLQHGGDFSWRIITWLQLLFSCLIAFFCFFLPESPRWQYVHNKQESAKAMLTKYHGRGNAESPWVTLQLHEYEEFLNMDGADKRWWDYRALFRDRPSVYRLMCNVIISIWGQWAGNAVLSYYLGDVLDTCGYTDQVRVFSSQKWKLPRVLISDRWSKPGLHCTTMFSNSYLRSSAHA